MHRIRLGSVAAVAAAIAVLGLGACGGDSDSSSTAADTTGQTAFTGIPREKLKACLSSGGLQPGDSNTTISAEGAYEAKGILVTFPSGTPVFLFATPNAQLAKSAKTIATHPPPPKAWVVEQRGNVLVIYQAHPTAKEKAQINSCLPG